MEEMVHRGQSWVHHQEHLVMELQDHHQEDILVAAAEAAAKYLLIPLLEELEVEEILENLQVKTLLEIQAAAEAAAM
jgi:hypothetical protein